MAVRNDVAGLGWAGSSVEIGGCKGDGTLIGTGTVVGSTGTGGGGGPASDTDFLRLPKNEAFFLRTAGDACCGSGAAVVVGGGGCGCGCGEGTGAEMVVLLVLELLELSVVVELELPPPPNTLLKNPGRDDLVDPAMGGAVVVGGGGLANAGSGGSAIGCGGA
jgi:hypothetical protein